MLKAQLFVTKDSGKTWSLIKLDFLPYKILPHRIHKDLVLGYDLRELKVLAEERKGYLPFVVTSVIV